LHPENWPTKALPSSDIRDVGDEKMVAGTWLLLPKTSEKNLGEALV